MAERNVACIEKYVLCLKYRVKVMKMWVIDRNWNWTRSKYLKPE